MLVIKEKHMSKRSERRREKKRKEREEKRKNKKPKINYREYIRSKEWQEKARAIKKERGYICELCGASGKGIVIHAHHKTYERLGNEDNADIMLLCSTCHTAFHTARENAKKKNRNKKPTTKNEILFYLWVRGITYVNDDPRSYYELGKSFIKELVPLPEDVKLYRLYSKINNEIYNKAALNNNRREYVKAKAQPDNCWQGFGSEDTWRSEFNYWENV